jgi:hypothetical protein
MLMRLFAPKFPVVGAFVGSAVAVHPRGNARLRFWQACGHSTLMAPLLRHPLRLLVRLLDQRVPDAVKYPSTGGAAAAFLATGLA